MKYEMKYTSDPMGELYQNKSFRILQSSSQPFLDPIGSLVSTLLVSR